MPITEPAVTTYDASDLATATVFAEVGSQFG